MNRTILIGRLTRDVDIRYSQGQNQTAIARYTLAVDRKFKDSNGNYTADFINCVAFGKSAEFAEKYFHKGLKIAVVGRLQSGSYTDKDGRKVYTTDVVVEEQEFCESKGNSNQPSGQQSVGQNTSSNDGFLNIPEGLDDDTLPFD